MFGFPIEEITGKSRQRPLVTARQIAMYVFRELTDLSYPAIAREFGGRDHTTVIHAVEKISAQMQERSARSTTRSPSSSRPSGAGRGIRHPRWGQPPGTAVWTTASASTPACGQLVRPAATRPRPRHVTCGILWINGRTATTRADLGIIVRSSPIHSPYHHSFVCEAQHDGRKRATA